MNNDSHYLDTFIGKYEDSIILSTSLDKTQGEKKKKKKNSKSRTEIVFQLILLCFID